MSSKNSERPDSNKMNRIEDVYYKKLSKKKIVQYNKGDLSNLILEELEKLVTFTTQNFNNSQSSFTTSNKNDNNEKKIEQYNKGDLSNLTLEELEKLANFTTQNFNNSQLFY